VRSRFSAQPDFLVTLRCLFDQIFHEVTRALDNASKKWTMPIKHWKQALQQFAIYFPDRVPVDQP
jgi:hypothetical protein